MSVHNHGTTEGRGLDCPERIIDGQLRGHCVVPIESPRVEGERVGREAVQRQVVSALEAVYAEALRDIGSGDYRRGLRDAITIAGGVR